jgi:hypothetical protein
MAVKVNANVVKRFGLNKPSVRTGPGREFTTNVAIVCNAIRCVPDTDICTLRIGFKT